MSKDNPLGGFQRRRIAALWILTAVVSLALIFTRSAWAEKIGIMEPEELIEAIGLALIAFGVMIRLWSTLYIGGRKSTTLVRRGPYSVSRNPLYLGSIVAAAGVGAQTGSLVIAALIALVATAVFQVTIRREEVFLAGEFGEEFKTYCAEVPRLFPSFTRFVDEPVLTVDTSRLYRTLRDGLWFFAAFPLFEGLEWMHHAGIVPVLFRLY